MKPFNFSFDFPVDVNILYNTGNELLIKGVKSVTSDNKTIAIFFHPRHNYYGSVLDENGERLSEDIDLLLSGTYNPTIVGRCDDNYHRIGIELDSSNILQVKVSTCSTKGNAEVRVLS